MDHYLLKFGHILLSISRVSSYLDGLEIIEEREMPQVLTLGNHTLKDDNIEPVILSFLNGIISKYPKINLSHVIAVLPRHLYAIVNQRKYLVKAFDALFDDYLFIAEEVALASFLISTERQLKNKLINYWSASPLGLQWTEMVIETKKIALMRSSKLPANSNRQLLEVLYKKKFSGQEIQDLKQKWTEKEFIATVNRAFTYWNESKQDTDHNIDTENLSPGIQHELTLENLYQRLEELVNNLMHKDEPKLIVCFGGEWQDLIVLEKLFMEINTTSITKISTQQITEGAISYYRQRSEFHDLSPNLMTLSSNKGAGKELDHDIEFTIENYDEWTNGDESGYFFWLTSSAVSEMVIKYNEFEMLLGAYNKDLNNSIQVSFKDAVGNAYALVQPRVKLDIDMNVFLVLQEEGSEIFVGNLIHHDYGGGY